MSSSNSTNGTNGPCATPRNHIVNALSVDVEDYFQVQALAGAYDRSQWDGCESRVERNVDRILTLFGEAGVTGTFFSLGWIAERHPNMVRRIVSAGHELASHGYCHLRVDGQTPQAFRDDVRRTKAILEDCASTPIRGYRAATFSVGPHTMWAFRVLEEEGYAYSSSIYPVTHDNYAFPNAPRFAFRPQDTKEFWELPIATIRLAGHNCACGGGGYFRFFPYAVTRAFLGHINRHDGKPAVFYFHPWEIDPDQPRPFGLPLKSRIRHYLNLSKTESRLTRLLRDFSWDRVDRVLERATGSHSEGSEGSARHAG
jgi:peptidoglycan-N-acetylglucosamine deacetylase